MLAPWKKSYDQPRQHIKKQRHYFCGKGPHSQSYVFSSSHTWMWKSDFIESWAPKNWCFWTVILEKTLKSPLDCKDIQPVHPKGDQSWEFTGRTDAEAEGTIFWPPDEKNWLIWKDPDAGKDWRREEKGTTGWDGWMASLTQRTWVWVSSESWWWIGKPGVLQTMGSQRVRHYWVTELIDWLNTALRSIMLELKDEASPTSSAETPSPTHARHGLASDSMSYFCFPITPTPFWWGSIWCNLLSDLPSTLHHYTHIHIPHVLF